MYEQLRGLMRGVLKTKGGSDLKGFDAAPDLNSQSPFTTFQTPVHIPVAGFSSIKASKVSPIPKIGSYRYYALYRGRDAIGKEVGGKIFLSWEGIKPYVEGVPGNIHKGFDLQYQAENFSMTGDANISQEALLEFLARPEPKPSKAPAKKDQRESLFNPKYHQLRTVIEGDEEVSLAERRLMDQLEAQQIFNRVLQLKTERLLEELGSVRSGGSLKRAEARKASGGSVISSVSHCLEFEGEDGADAHKKPEGKSNKVSKSSKGREEEVVAKVPKSPKRRPAKSKGVNYDSDDSEDSNIRRRRRERRAKQKEAERKKRDKSKTKSKRKQKAESSDEEMSEGDFSTEKSEGDGDTLGDSDTEDDKSRGHRSAAKSKQSRAQSDDSEDEDEPSDSSNSSSSSSSESSSEEERVG
jgi:hypothetical protein